MGCCVYVCEVCQTERKTKPHAGLCPRCHNQVELEWDEQHDHYGYEDYDREPLEDNDE